MPPCVPQGLKPDLLLMLNVTAEAVTYRSCSDYSLSVPLFSCGISEPLLSVIRPLCA